MRAGEIVLALLLIGPPVLALARMGRRARSPRGQARGRAGGGWLAHRRALRLEEQRHEHARIRDKARHEQRLAEQAAREARGGEEGGRRPRGGTVKATVTRIGGEPVPEPPARPAGTPSPSSGSPGPPAPPVSPGQPASPPQPPAREGSVPRPAPPAPGPPSPTPEGAVMTVMPDSPGALAVPGVEMIIEGAAALRRHMMSGNAVAKRQGVIGIAVAGDALAGTVRAVAGEMSEPGQHYGTEVTEPLAMTAVHYTAASLGLSEVEGRLLAIIRAAEELRASGVQAPHHDQMTAR